MMTKKVTSVALSLALLATMGSALAQEIGVASAVRNDVAVKSLEEDAARTAEIGTDIKLRDEITSGERAAMQVLLLDETTFTVGPKAQLTVDEFIYDPNADTGAMTARVTKGAFRFMSGKTAKNPDDVKLETPVASMGIRGTIVEGAVGEDAVRELSGLDDQFQGIEPGPNATVIVLRGPSSTTGGNLTREGEVTVTTPDGRTVVLTRTNTAVFIPDNGNGPIGPFTLPQPAVNDFGATIVSIPDGDPVSPVPDIERPSATVIVEEEPIEPEIQDPEEEQVVDRPTIDCPVQNGIPVTGGGLILNGNGGQQVDDFGLIDC